MSTRYILAVFLLYSSNHYGSAAWQDVYVSPAGQKVLSSPSDLSDSKRNGLLLEQQQCVVGVGVKTLEVEMKKVFPSAEKIGAVLLAGYRLDIITYDETLASPILEPFPDCGRQIYGVAFAVKDDDVTIYNENHADYRVDTASGLLLSNESSITCLLYYPKVHPSVLGYGETFPWYKWLTFDYMKLTVQGMRDAGFPDEYITDVSSLPTADDDTQFEEIITPSNRNNYNSNLFSKL